MNGPILPRVEALAELWRGGGFTVKCFDDMDQLVWEKLICNCAFSGSSEGHHTIYGCYFMASRSAAGNFDKLVFHRVIHKKLRIFPQEPFIRAAQNR
jgi:hypothetical protein